MAKQQKLSDQLAVLIPAPVKVGNLSPAPQVKRGRRRPAEDDPRYSKANPKGR
jgi:hypothetical protein